MPIAEADGVPLYLRMVGQRFTFTTDPAKAIEFPEGMGAAQAFAMLTSLDSDGFTAADEPLTFRGVVESVGEDTAVLRNGELTFAVRARKPIADGLRPKVGMVVDLQRSVSWRAVRPEAAGEARARQAMLKAADRRHPLGRYMPAAGDLDREWLESFCAAFVDRHARHEFRWHEKDWSCPRYGKRDLERFMEGDFSRACLEHMQRFAEFHNCMTWLWDEAEARERKKMIADLLRSS